MKQVCLLLSLAITGCAPAAWQAGLETAGMVVDTAAVVRARQIGLCGDAPQRRLATPDDVVAMQAEIEELKRELSVTQGQLTRLAIDHARAPLPQYDLPPVVAPPKPSGTPAPMPALPPP